MKKVLITGGAGFIGYHLANNLLKSNYQIDLIDNFSRGVNDLELVNLSNNKNINLIDSDLSKPNIINKLSKNYAYIYHFAAVIGVQHVLKSPNEVLEKNYTLLQNALTIGHQQKRLDRFVFASTSEVYAGTLYYHGLEFPTPESTPLTISNLGEARTSYMLSKIYGEALCKHSGLQITIVRPHNFYGPRMGLSHVIPEMMKKVELLSSDYIDVYSIHHRRTFCYIEDAVKAIQKLAESNNTIGREYNVGNDDEEVTIEQLVKLIMNLIGKNFKIRSMPDTPGSPERRCPNISKLRKEIGYKKEYDLNKGLEKTFNWYKKNIFSGIEKSAL